MIRKLLSEDIDRVADIWLKTNLKAHYFISNQYWKSSFDGEIHQRTVLLFGQNYDHVRYNTVLFQPVLQKWFFFLWS